MKFNPLQPYNELPILPPSAEIETKAVLKACIEARVALAELRQAGNRIPNQAVLINAIPMLEAQASSEIENIVTTGDAMFRYAEMENQAQDPATKEALRYRSALHEGFRSLSERPLCTNTAIRVCSRIKNAEMDIRRITGTALENRVTGEIIYTPPVGENLLREKLANWERFIHESTQIDPLVRMAVAHYQFEAIHPFVDGNGRTGRILNLLVLIEQGLLDIPVLYLSRHILRTRDRYYDGLLSVTRSEQWEPWILYMLEAVCETAKWTTAKIEAIAVLQHAAKRFVKQHAPKLYSHELINTMFAQPYCRIQNLVDTGIVKRQTASSYLQQLSELGMLREIQIGRDKLFMHPQFLRLLTSDTHEVPEYRATNLGRP